MKKLLAILSSLTLIVSGSSSIMGMNLNNKIIKQKNEKMKQKSINYLKNMSLTIENVTPSVTNENVTSSFMI